MRKLITPLRVANRFVTTPLGVIAGFIVLVLALMTVADITARLFLSSSIPGAVEISEVLLVVCVFFAFGAAQASGAHVATSVLTERLTKRGRLILIRIAAAIVCVLLIAMIVATIDEAIQSTIRGDYRFGLVHVPLWPAKVAVASGMVVYLLEFVRTNLATRDIPLADEVQVEVAAIEADPKGQIR